ncbi:hypothetical protein Ancab_039955 [Ancistrocladus abbreviatus]
MDEIQHPLHPPHPLSKEVIRHGKLECAICHILIMRRGYGCNECNFYLHTRCAELPPELLHPLHPTHALKLRRMKGGMKTMPDCALCSAEVKDQILIYECDNRDNMCFEVGYFIMHVNCALLKPSKKHPFHEHPLVLIKEYRCLANCAACGTEFQHSKDDSSDLYRCLECNIRIHQGCFDTPKEFEHRVQGAQQCRSEEIHHLTHYCPLHNNVCFASPLLMAPHMVVKIVDFF